MQLTVNESECKNRADVAIRAYRPADRDAFERLNRAWLEKYFCVEPIDEALFAAPEKLILKMGGAIFVAELTEKIAGVCALIRSEEKSSRVFEFSKMGVEEKLQGRGIGRALTVHALQWARAQHAERVIIYSNRKLAPAIHLYCALGFQEIPLSDEDRKKYQRGNIKLELVF